MEVEWFEHHEWWFADGAFDTLLCKKYEHLLSDSCDSASSIDRILIYDQLPRHVYRNVSAAHIIEYFLQKALKVNIDLDSLDDNRFCFALLPLRHTMVFDNILRVLDLTWERINRRDSLILRKFLRATYQRMPYKTAQLEKGDGDLNYSNVDEFVKLPEIDRPIVISLSGGVDSMVCSLILGTRYKNVRAVHINYNNRPTSDKEAEFVVDWCHKHDIQCYVRKIVEIRREPCMTHGLRDLYETYTRNVRYNCYKDFGDCVIVLGHNKDDILENIFTNIAHKTKYDNLDGMTEWSKQDNITFWRPLLVKSKSDIISYADVFNIPHLPNSTPVWSQRGQIRASIVPVVEKWNPGFVESMHKLSETMKNLYEIMEDHVDHVLKTVVKKDQSIYLKLDKLHKSDIFWRMLFSKLNINISGKSISNLTTRLSKDDIIIKIQINKNVQMFVHDVEIKLVGEFQD